MFSRVFQWAIAILALALFVSLLLDIIPFWSFYALLIVCGLGSAGDAVRIAITKPRSQERFHSLCHRLSAAAIAMVVGAIGLFGQVDLGMDSRMRSRASMVMYLCVPVCLIAYFGWYQHVSKNYGIQKSHPDFGEDEEGNPLRPNETDQE
jgi:amino acid permease